MKKLLLGAMTLALWLAPLSGAWAKDGDDDAFEPVLVVSSSGYNALLADLDVLGAAADQPDLSKLVDFVVSLQAKGLDGFDKARPLGVVVSLDDNGLPAVMGFVPVTDVKKLFKAFEPLGVKTEEPQDGVIKVTMRNAPPLYVKEQKGWAYVAQNDDSFEDLPEDPTPWLGGLDKEYDLAARLNVQNVPDELFDNLIDQMVAGAKSGLQRLPNESDDAFEARKLFVTSYIEQIAEALEQVESLTYGLKIDNETKRLLLDLTAMAVPDSDLAKQTAAEQPASKFLGFVSGKSPIRALSVLAVNETDAEQFEQLLETLRKQAGKQLDDDQSVADEDKPAVKKIVGTLIDVAEKTLKAGVLEGGMAVEGEGPFTFVAGGKFVGSDKLESTLKDGIALLQKRYPKDAEKVAVKYDVDKYGDVRFHSISPPSDDPPPPEVKKIMGENPLLVVAYGTDSAYVAFGDKPIESIKAVIDRSKTGDGPNLPMQLTVEVLPLVKFAAKMAPDDKVQQLVEGLDGSKDQANVTVSNIKNGGRFRIELEEQVMAIIGRAVKLSAQKRF